MQDKMRGARDDRTRQHRLKLRAAFETLQVPAAQTGLIKRRPVSLCLNSQTLAAFGATRVDHGTAATGFHADQKAVSAGATNFGRLVCAFHFGNPKKL
jgi:hypothetical protein